MKKLIVLAVVSVASVQSGQAQYFEDKQNAQLIANISKMKKNVGKTIWAAGGGWNGGLIELCPSATGNFDACRALKPGEAATIAEVIAAGPRPPGKPTTFDHIAYRVVMKDGASGFIPTSEYAYYTFEDPKVTAQKQVAAKNATAEDCAKRGQPKIGMTQAEAVATCWGKPTRIVKQTTAAGAVENYIYTIGHALRFEEGHLAVITETK